MLTTWSESEKEINAKPSSTLFWVTSNILSAFRTHQHTCRALVHDVLWDFLNWFVWMICWHSPKTLLNWAVPCSLGSSGAAGEKVICQSRGMWVPCPLSETSRVHEQGKWWKSRPWQSGPCWPLGNHFSSFWGLPTSTACSSAITVGLPFLSPSSPLPLSCLSGLLKPLRHSS